MHGPTDRPMPNSRRFQEVDNVEIVVHDRLEEPDLEDVAESGVWVCTRKWRPYRFGARNQSQRTPRSCWSAPLYRVPVTIGETKARILLGKDPPRHPASGGGVELSAKSEIVGAENDCPVRGLDSKHMLQYHCDLERLGSHSHRRALLHRPGCEIRGSKAVRSSSGTTNTQCRPLMPRNTAPEPALRARRR